MSFHRHFGLPINARNQKPENTLVQLLILIATFVAAAICFVLIVLYS